MATDLFHTITTPQAYLTSYFGDPFADTKGCVFAYYKDTNGWIVASFGPDTDENDEDPIVGDIGFSTPYTVETRYDSRIAQPSELLVTGDGQSGEACTYDPTNGTVTSGDIYRVKQ
ncbi:hypothetical protein JW926_02580 [Candidatus Sumerlaeota bacterium]|nr:hypothetical protein [Candidatus Sumerlaeota bacterium]